VDSVSLIIFTTQLLMLLYSALLITGQKRKMDRVDKKVDEIRQFENKLMEIALRDNRKRRWSK